jgi:hypothetical protein
LDSFNINLYLHSKWQRHPGAEISGWKPLPQSANYFLHVLKDARFFMFFNLRNLRNPRIEIGRGWKPLPQSANYFLHILKDARFLIVDRGGFR